MTNQERLVYAENKLDEAIRNRQTEDILYWRGYRDGVQRAVEKENMPIVKPACLYCRGVREIGKDNGVPIYLDTRGEVPIIDGDEWHIEIKYCPFCGESLEGEV